MFLRSAKTLSLFWQTLVEIIRVSSDAGREAKPLSLLALLSTVVVVFLSLLDPYACYCRPSWDTSVFTV